MGGNLEQIGFLELRTRIRVSYICNLTWYKLCFIAYIQYPTLVTDILVSHFTQITYTYYCTCNMLPNYKDKNKKGTKGKRGQPL